MTTVSSDKQHLVSFRARPKGPKCPFGNTEVQFYLRPGSCLWLQGDSGLGKSSLATILANLSSSKTLIKVHQLDVKVEWHPSIPVRERCGVLFQQTTLLDELTVAGNLQLALDNAARTTSSTQNNTTVQQLLESVGLNYVRDASKRPSELSGGMGRRASLALQLAQRKRVIVLDEPFTGLDRSAAMSVARELVHLRQTVGTALLLISHEPDLAALVMGDDEDDQTKAMNQTILLQKPPIFSKSSNNGYTNGHHHSSSKKPSLFGITFFQRFMERLVDYVLWSLPLILLTFFACGMAISMLSADMLQRVDVTEHVLDIVDREVRPLIKLLTGEDPSAFTMMGVKFKVRGMLNSTVPQAKATLFAVGMTKLFLLEIGPLLTALLLCGRIGGSYAGKVATMQATAQTKLLQTLGISPMLWTLAPALLASMMAAPLLTMLGTALGVALGSVVGPKWYGIGTTTSYLEEVRASVFPELRLRSFAPLWEVNSTKTWTDIVMNEGPVMDLRPTFSTSFRDSVIEIVTYPVVYHILKAVVYMLIIMIVAETMARLRPNLTARGVPGVITSSVVTAGLLVIVMDWGFSQLWLMRV